jgi:hypothetical protein
MRSMTGSWLIIRNEHDVHCAKADSMYTHHQDKYDRVDAGLMDV